MTPTNRPTWILHTLQDPEELRVCSHGEVGGFLEIRCETPHYPIFEVRFTDKNPSSGAYSATFIGSINFPVIIPLNIPDDYSYTVHHYPDTFMIENGKLEKKKKKTGGKRRPVHKSGPYPCGIIPCKGCK